ncbi:MAG: hypothetical protein WBM50_06535 [Acidimicrobiales bacterium]
MTPHHTLHLVAKAAASAVGLVLFASACSNGSADEPRAQASITSEVDEFCAASVDAYRLGGADSGEEGDLGAAKAYAQAILPVAERLLASAPARVRADVEVMVSSARAAADSGDLSGFQAPEFAAAEANWHAAGVADCDWAVFDVQLLEYEFSGLPDTVPAGVASFELTNTGQEFHVLAILRRNDGVTATFDELLALPDGEGFASLTDAGSGFAAPGQTGYALADLTPGDYIAICPIPVGATLGTEPGPDAEPHYQTGMRHSFTVTEAG